MGETIAGSMAALCSY